MSIRAIVTDIEGTTSSIAFVHDVLFPYAADRLPDYLRNNSDDPEVARLLQVVREEANLPSADLDSIIAVLLKWIADDRKATALKALQGMVWRHGYEQGDFTGHIYDDAAIGLRAWADAGIELYVYSSGSVDAQKLLFGYSDAGDLREYFRGYFDTETGHKRERDSYTTIAQTLAMKPAEILFLSDVAEELDAARDAGMHTVQLVRNEEVVRGDHPIARDFTEVMLN